jgi:hypothetical protein
MVGTMNPRRVGHVWVLEVDKNDMMTVYDNGYEVPFGSIRFGEVLWVRKCVSFVKQLKQKKVRPRKRKARSSRSDAAPVTRESPATSDPPPATKQSTPSRPKKKQRKRSKHD